MHVSRCAQPADKGVEAGGGLQSPALAKNVVAVGAGYKTNDNSVLEDVLTVRGVDAGGREVFSLPVSAQGRERGWSRL